MGETTLKFCKDCRHYLPASFESLEAQAEFSRCAAIASAESVRLHRIDGRSVKQLYCEIARGNDGQCGPDAKLFEAPNA